MTDPDNSTTAGIADVCGKFLSGFKKGKKYVYYDKVQSLTTAKDPILVIDYTDIERAVSDNSLGAEAQELASLIVLKPQEAIAAFKVAAATMIKEIDEDFDTDTVNIRFKNIPVELEIPQIGVQHVGKMVNVAGIINMLEPKTAVITKASYLCMDCQVHTEAYTRNNNHKPVSTCSACEKHSMVLDEEASEKLPFQRVSVQQMHDKVEPGAMAQDCELWMFGEDLMNRVSPGETVRVTGTVKLKPRSNRENSRFDYYIEVSAIQSIHDEEVTIDDPALMEAVENAIREGHEQEDFDKLWKSVCPAIQGEDDIKKGLLLQLVGGEAWFQPDGSRLRGDINILLVGDPGTGKTTMMRWQKRVPARAVYVTGRGFSKAGLTAALIREEGSLPRILPGAYMLSDRGICIVDEVEKTESEDRQVLPSLMDDQQIFNLSKFGINKELPIQTASLHGGNPIGNRYDPTKPLSENLTFDQWLFDRYDLKFVLRNIPNQEKDAATSQHTTDMMLQGMSARALAKKSNEMGKIEGVHDIQFMKAWVAHVKKTYDPKPTQEAMEFIKEYYMDLRADESVQNEITMREMGTLFRLARASARAHMSHVVTLADVQFGIDLLSASMRTYGIDPATGKRTGKFIVITPHDKKKTAKLSVMLKQLLKKLGGDGSRTFTHRDIIDFMGREGFARTDVQHVLEQYLTVGAIYCPVPGKPEIYKLNLGAWR